MSTWKMEESVRQRISAEKILYQYLSVHYIQIHIDLQKEEFFFTFLWQPLEIETLEIKPL